MSDYVLHFGAIVKCAHESGQATPTVPNLRVRVSGKPTVLQNAPYAVAGCPLNSPCVTAMWRSGASKVSSMGQPLVLMDSESTAVPTGDALKTVSSQTRVSAT